MVSLIALFAAGCIPNPDANTVDNRVHTNPTNDSMQPDETTPAASETTNQYIESANADYSLIGKEPVTLFFHATWCPTCKRMKKDIKADLSNFPANTKIIEADYDTATDLKQKYGVTAQTTFVVLDANGNVVDKATVPSLDWLKSTIETSTAS